MNISLCFFINLKKYNIIIIGEKKNTYNYVFCYNIKQFWYIIIKIQNCALSLSGRSCQGLSQPPDYPRTVKFQRLEIIQAFKHIFFWQEKNILSSTSSKSEPTSQQQSPRIIISHTHAATDRRSSLLISSLFVMTRHLQKATKS